MSTCVNPETLSQAPQIWDSQAKQWPWEECEGVYKPVPSTKDGDTASLVRAWRQSGYICFSTSNALSAQIYPRLATQMQKVNCLKYNNVLYVHA
jgi:hypothetical protein